MRRIKIMAVFLLATCWLGACARPSPTASPLPTPSPTSTLVPYPTPATGISVADIALTGPGEGWAVVNEWTKVSIRTSTRGVIYRLVNGRWSRVPDAPATAGAYSCYKAIAATGSEDVWVAGMGYGVYGCQEGNVLVHYRGGWWDIIDIEHLFTSHSADGSYYYTRTTGLFDIDMIGAGRGWAVGWNTILGYDRGHWSVEFDAPAPWNRLGTISMANLTDGWAGGESSLYRYHQGFWARWEDQGFESAIVTDIHTLSSDEAWAVGYCHMGSYPEHKVPVPFIWHYASGRWQEIRPPIGTGRLWSVKMIGVEEGWAVGEQQITYHWSQGEALVLHYHNGHWESVPVPSDGPLRTVDAVDSEHVWAGGDGFYRYAPATGWRRVDVGPEDMMLR